MNKLLTISILILAQIHIRESYLIYKTTNLICEPNPKYIANVTCSLKPVNRYKTIATMDCHIVDVLRNVTIQFQSYMKNSANKYYPYVIKAEGNACDAFDKTKLPLLHIYAKRFAARLSNINHSCPYRGWVFARNAYLDERIVPPVIVSPGFYRVEFRFLEGYPYKNLGLITGYLQVIDIRNSEIKKVHHGT